CAWTASREPLPVVPAGMPVSALRELSRTDDRASRQGSCHVRALRCAGEIGDEACALLRSIWLVAQAQQIAGMDGGQHLPFVPRQELAAHGLERALAGQRQQRGAT